MPEQKQTARIEAFSDGVLAIVITLLALELRVPQPGGDEDSNLIRALLAEWPTYLAFLASFFYILVIWINHHRLFTAIRRSDNNLMLLNGLLLLGVTVIPFGTELIATYLQHPEQNVAAMIYSAIFLVNSIFFNGLWHYASYKNRLFDSETEPELVRFITRQYAFGPILYTVALVLAAFSAQASLLLSLGMAVFFALPSRRSQLMTISPEASQRAAADTPIEAGKL
jgi:uncharacterized membrane protein